MQQANRVEISGTNRATVWLASWSWNAGRATGACLYATADEAIRCVVAESRGNGIWEPSPSRGSHLFEHPDSRSPQQAFRISWNDGYAEVTRFEVDAEFTAAAPMVDYINCMLHRMANRKARAATDG